MIAATLSTSISLRAARTAASGLVWSSSRDELDLAAQHAAGGVDLVAPPHSIALRIDGP